jgi:hypothetical protein
LVNDFPLGLICSADSCSSSFEHKGGLWDDADDCCENLCRSDNLCGDEEVSQFLSMAINNMYFLFKGVCSSSTHCLPGHSCVTCNDPDNFNPTYFPNMSSKGYLRGAKCCRYR